MSFAIPMLRLKVQARKTGNRHGEVTGSFFHAIADEPQSNMNN